LAANVIRLACWGALSAPMVIWCSVAAEGCALLVSLRSIFQPVGIASLESEMAAVQEV
jgi:hypothetical protein